MPQVIYIVVAHDQTCGVPSRYIVENAALLCDVATYANELNFFVAILSLDQEKSIDRVSIGPSFCVPFCLRALAPLLLAGLNFWVKLLRELNTALLNFFWGSKKDLVAFDDREDSGFQLVSFPSLAKCIPSLPSGSSVCVFLLVSLLNFCCYNRFGVDPVFVIHTFIPCLPGFCRLSMLPCSILKTS